MPDDLESGVVDPDAIGFGALIARLLRWEGEHIGVTGQGPPSKGGNTCLSLHGVLTIDEDLAVHVIDPRGGRIEASRVGDGQVQMLEGDFHAAEITDWGNGRLSISADFEAVTLNFAGPLQDR